MTLVSDIIRDAYRESNLIAISADPTSAEQTEGLRLLNRFVSSVYGLEDGEGLQPILVGRNNISRPSGYPDYNQVPDETDWFVPANSRLILNLTSAQSVYLDPNPEDGARFSVQDKSGNLATYNLTVYGNGRTIASATSVTLSTNSLNRDYTYRAESGDWTVVSPLIAADTFPFPTEFEDLFVIGLAIRLNPRHAVELDSQSEIVYQRLMRSFKARYRQHNEVGAELGLLKTTGYRHSSDGRKNHRDFDAGRPR